MKHAIVLFPIPRKEPAKRIFLHILFAGLPYPYPMLCGPVWGYLPKLCNPLQALDKNHDGFISRKEFTKISKNLTSDQVQWIHIHEIKVQEVQLQKVKVRIHRLNSQGVQWAKAQWVKAKGKVWLKWVS